MWRIFPYCASLLRHIQDLIAPLKTLLWIIFPTGHKILNGIHLWPIDFAVARMSTGLDFVGDPADELIAATSVVHDVPLLTRDRVIRRSAMVPLA